jgi:hypothetical protein
MDIWVVVLGYDQNSLLLILFKKSIEKIDSLNLSILIC